MVHSSEDTDFLQPPLVDIFGYRGNEAIENQVLQGTYVPPALASRHAKLFLSQCTLPDDLPPSDPAISMADHSSTWWKAKEATTGGKSNLTFAMYKALPPNKQTLSWPNSMLHSVPCPTSIHTLSGDGSSVWMFNC